VTNWVLLGCRRRPNDLDSSPNLTTPPLESRPVYHRARPRSRTLTSTGIRNGCRWGRFRGCECSCPHRRHQFFQQPKSWPSLGGVPVVISLPREAPPAPRPLRSDVVAGEFGTSTAVPDFHLETSSMQLPDRRHVPTCSVKPPPGHADLARSRMCSRVLAAWRAPSVPRHNHDSAPVQLDPVIISSHSRHGPGRVDVGVVGDLLGPVYFSTCSV